MKTIFKYPVDVTDRQQIEMPEGAELLGIQTQNGQPCIWALVDDERETTTRNIVIHGTGHKISDPTLTYIGTFQMHGGALVFHAFESHL